MNISDLPIELLELAIDTYYQHIRFINTSYNIFINSVYNINALYQRDILFYDIIVFNIKLVIFYNTIFNTSWSFYYNLRVNSIRHNLLNCYIYAIDNNNICDKQTVIDYEIYKIFYYDRHIFLKYVHSKYSELFEVESEYTNNYRKKCLKYVYANNCCYCPQYLIDKYNLSYCNLDKYKN